MGHLERHSVEAQSVPPAPPLFVAVLVVNGGRERHG